jgi:hypothetical protein
MRTKKLPVKIECVIDRPTKKKLTRKAKSQGLSVAALMRMIVRSL